MLLVSHITLAIDSIICVSVSLFYPSKNTLRVSLMLASTAIVNGLILGILHPEHIGKNCVSGLLFIAYVATAARVVKTKLTWSTMIK